MKTWRVASNRVALTACALALGLMLVFSAGADAASKAKRPTKKITYDPSAAKVDFFDSIEAGSLKARLVMKDASQGNLLVENPGDKPLSVKLPDAMVGVQVLKQLGGGGNAGGGTDGGGGSTAQSVGGGGGLGGGGFGGGGFGGGGGGFFSVAPEQTVSIPFNSVCLEHGKADPRPSMHYAVKPVDSFSTDPALVELLKVVATGKIKKQVAQAAAWHVSNGMSWNDLAAKQYDRVGQADTPYFNPNDLAAARSLVAQASSIAREKRLAEPKSEEPTVPANPRGVRTFQSTGVTVGTPVGGN